jgi:c-di-GMP-binding flagellar brake protein YcgR
MENIHYIIIGAIVLFIIGIVVYFQTRNKNNEDGVKKVNRSNKRENFRLRIDIEDALVEITQIGESEVKTTEVCEIVDVSANGMGVYSDHDYPIRQKVHIKVLFKLNFREFSMEGMLVRKVEASNKDKILYGIKFINLSDSDENRLQKEIAAIDNSRRLKPIR